MPSSIPTPVIAAGLVIVGDIETLGDDLPADSIALANPKSSTLHHAVVANLDVRGLQIAVNDSLLVRGFERLRDLFRDRQCFGHGNRTLRDAIGERRPFGKNFQRDIATELRIPGAVHFAHAARADSAHDFHTDQGECRPSAPREDERL